MRRRSITITPRNLRLVRLFFRLLARTSTGGGGATVTTEFTGNVKVRVFMPLNRTPEAGLLWLHGGGFMVGTPRHENRWCINMVRELPVFVVVPHYRLAPEHPFPEALDDCIDTWKWTADRAKSLGINPGAVGIGGRSAGGGLAACLAQVLRETAVEQPASQLLIYPMLDDHTAARSDIGLRAHLVWNRESNLTGWQSYLGFCPNTADPPPHAVAARCRDLTGLPPAWIGVGTRDLFLDENREYADRLVSAGVSCELKVMNDAHHGFDNLDSDSAASVRFFKDQVEFLRTTLCAR